jgi:hypothetical protein
MLPYAIELGGEFCGQLTIGNVTQVYGSVTSALVRGGHASWV